jgi:hypothetical protein
VAVLDFKGFADAIGHGDKGISNRRWTRMNGDKMRGLWLLVFDEVLGGGNNAANFELGILKRSDDEICFFLM